MNRAGRHDTGCSGIGLDVGNAAGKNNISNENRNNIELIKNYKVFGGINLISIFPICFVENVWFYMKNLWKDTEEQQIIVVLLSLLIVFLMINMLITFLVSLSSFMKTRADTYRLLLMLGIAKKDFWKLFLREYCVSTGYLVLAAVFGSQVLGMALTKCIFRKVVYFSILEELFHAFLIFLFMMFIYFVIVLFSVCIMLYKYRKKDIIVFFEKIVQSDVRLRRKPVFYAVNPIIGIGLTALSFLMLINYSVGRMLLAVFVNSIGILILVNTDGFILRRFIKKFKRIYYYHIMKWNNLFYQYRVNAKVVFVIYILNFLLTFIIGGLIVSIGSENQYEKYPYKVVVYGSQIYENVKDCYLCMTVDIRSVGEATAISNSDLNKMIPSGLEIDRGVVLYYGEKAAETFPPLENVEFLIIQSGEKQQKFRILDADWKILFGENIFPELNTIVIMNDEDFMAFTEYNEVKSIVATNDLSIIETMKDDTDNKVWFQSEQIEQDNIYNNILIVTLYIIGFVFILESQSLVMIRQILDDTNERYQYQVLNQLGIEKKELRSIQNGKIKNTIIFPEVSAIITGIIFFMADYFYQIQGNIEWDVLFQYIKILVSFGLIQYIGYRVVICVINRYYTGRF